MDDVPALAGIHELLVKMDARLAAVEVGKGFGSSKGGASGLFGGPSSSLADAVVEARRLLGLGRGEGGGDGDRGERRLGTLRAAQGFSRVGAAAGSDMAGGLGAVPAAAAGAQDSQALLAEAIRQFSAVVGRQRPSLEEAYGLAGGAATGEEDYQALWGDPGSSSSLGLGRVGGAQALERIRRTRQQRPDVVVVAHEKSARADLGTLAGES